jgi:RNA polymerase sigma-70 factor (ECF subfamily)
MHPELDTDATLIERVAQGDEDALAALYGRYGKTAYGLALRILRDRHLAEDATQDAFLALWRSARTFDPQRASPSTWIHVLVHRRAVDLVRRQERRRACDLAELPAADDGPGPEEIALAWDASARVREALAALSPAQRQIVELAYYGGLTQTEISARLGVPVGTVKSRTFAALSRLAERLAESDSIGAQVRAACSSSSSSS